MPIGDYKDLASCISDQVSKGKSKEEAGAICAKIAKQSGESINRDEQGRIIVAENVPLIFNASLEFKDE